MDELQTKVKSVVISGWVDKVDGSQVTVGFNRINLEGTFREQYVCNFNGMVGALVGERVCIKGELPRGAEGIIGRVFNNCEFC